VLVVNALESGNGNLLDKAAVQDHIEIGNWSFHLLSSGGGDFDGSEGGAIAIRRKSIENDHFQGRLPDSFTGWA
jgi:hypothetical protein